MQGVRQAEVQLGETAVRDRARPGRPARGAAAGRGRGPRLRHRRGRGPLPAGGEGRRGALLRPRTRPGSRRCERALLEASNGRGADHVLLAAGGHSNGPVETAARLARDRARVVDIGKTKLDLPWNAYYDKELDVRFSRSYGPGRYDDRYELEGIDYPAGYVRWTERRNLECFLDLIAREQIDVGSPGLRRLPDRRRDRGLPATRSRRPARQSASCFEYPRRSASRRPRRRRPPPVSRPAAPHHRRRRPARIHRRGELRVDDAAAAPGRRMRTRSLAHVATNKSLSAVNAQRRFGFATDLDRARTRCSTTSAGRGVHRDPAHTHADLACRALESGQGRLRREAAGADRRGAGPDRRHGRCHRQRPADGRVQPALRPAADRPAGPLRHARRQLGRRATWSTRAGSTPTSWYLDEDEEGTRFAGEGGHFIDTLSWWLDSLPDRGLRRTRSRRRRRAASRCGSRTARSARSATSTGGNARFPKETLDITGGGRSARLDNFQSASVWSGRRRPIRKARGGQDKGQRAELEHFVAAVQVRRPDADLVRLAGRHHPRDDRGRPQPGERPPGARVKGPDEPSAPGLVRPPPAPDVRHRADLAHPRPARRTAWAYQQVRPGQDAAGPPPAAQGADLRYDAPAAHRRAPYRRRPARR